VNSVGPSCRKYLDSHAQYKQQCEIHKCVFTQLSVAHNKLLILYQIKTNKRTRTSHHVIKTVLHSGVLQHLKGHLQTVYLIHFSSKFNRMSYQMENSGSQISHI